MATRTKDQNSYVHGSWNVICDVCGFKFKSCDVNKRWDGLYVCADDWEPRHESDFYKAPKEDPSVPFSRPDASESGGTDVSDNPFPPTFDATAKAQGDRPDTDADGLVEGDFLEYEADIDDGEANTGTVTKAT